MSIIYVKAFDEEIFRCLYEQISLSDIIPFDIETTGLSPFLDRIITIQLAFEKDIYVLDCRLIEREHIKKALEFIKKEGKKLVLHNASFDMGFIRNKFGVEFLNLFDTMVGEAIITAGVGKTLPSLSDLIEKYCGVFISKNTRETFIGLETLDLLTIEQIEYSATDVSFLREIYEKLSSTIESENLWETINLEMKLLPVIVDMELSGILLDVGKWSELAVRATERAKNYREEIKGILVNSLDFSLYQTALDAFRDLRIPVGTRKVQELLNSVTEKQEIRDVLLEHINLQSNVQLKTILGKYGLELESTNKKVLKSNKGDRVVDLILKMRENQILSTTFGLNMLELINPVTGRIHTHFLNTGTATGRFSSMSPNLQNIPSNSEYRGAFVSKSGHSLISTDYSQQEFRLAGAISGERVIIEAYKQNKDMHTATASIVYNKPLEEITKEERSFGKTLNFAILYGTTEYGLKHNLEITLDEAVDLISKFYGGYPNLAAFKKLAEEHILKAGYSKTLNGRKRYFSPPPIFADSFEMTKYISKLKKEGFNHIIQGSGADITKIALCNIYYNNPFGDKLKILLQVHDEIVVEVSDDILKEAEEFICEQMKSAEQWMLKDIPAEVESTTRKFWAK